MNDERVIEIYNKLDVICKRTELGDLETRMAAKLGAMEYWILQLRVEIEDHCRR